MIKVDKSNLERVIVKKEEIPFYNNYIKDIRSRMERPEFLGTFTNEELEQLLDSNSYIYFYKDNNNIASTSMIIPACDKDIKKFGLDLDYKEVADYGPEAVSDNYRGNGLQGYMLDELDKIANEKGYKYAVSTIHPENIYSINNFEKHGFKLVGLKDFKRGPRNIYYKELF